MGALEQFVVSAWKGSIEPYLLRQEYRIKRKRIQTWLADPHNVITRCCINLGPVHSCTCQTLSAQVGRFLNPCKRHPIDWSDQALYGRPTATILDLQRFSNFADYAGAVSKSSRGNDNRSVKKATRLGYQARIIDQGAYQASIDRINHSKFFRSGGMLLSGGLVLDALLPRTKLLDRTESTAWQPPCPEHWTCSWGVLKGHELVAYAVITRAGNIVQANHTMGHREALRNGVVKLLMFDMIKWMYEQDPAYTLGIRYFIYGVLEHGMSGLCEWKLRLQFQPSLLEGLTD